jgi:exopolysaccharide biosynthesis polyprenyl glycosylphosphotransferase
MTVTMPVRNDAAVATVEIVGPLPAATLPAGSTWSAPSTRPARLRSRFLPLSVLADGIVPLGLLPVLLQREVSINQFPTPTSIVVVASWLTLLAVFGAYDASRTVVDADLLRRLTMAGVCCAALLPVVISAAGDRVEPGPMLATAVLMTTAALLQRRVTQSLSSRAGALASPVRVVISGHRRTVDRVISELDADTRSTFEVVRVIGAGREGSELAAIAQHMGAQAVVVTPCRHHDPTYLRRLGWDLERTGVHLMVGTGLHDVSRFRTTMEYAGALPLVRVRPPVLDGAQMKVKRAVDAAVGLMALVALAPLMAVVALVISAESSGPAFFRQTRIGKDGRPFRIYKFRTMREGADGEHDSLAASTDGSHVLFKLQRDPRVTRVGAFLRKSSLDELPQLLNVVRGDMSLVGPRPALAGEVERYEPDTRRRLVVKPGITGLWQVSGRSDLSWDESVRLDLRYVDNWSLVGDLRIVGRTFGAVLSHRGAY